MPGVQLSEVLATFKGKDDSLGPLLDKLRAQMVGDQEAANQLNAALKQAGLALKDVNPAATQAASGFDTNAASLVKANSAYKDISASTQQAVTQLNQTHPAATQAAAGLNAAAQGAQQANVHLTQTHPAANNAASGLQNAATQAKQLLATMSQTAIPVGGLNVNLSALTSSLSALGPELVAAGLAAAALAVGLGASIEEAIKFQTELTQIQNNTTLTSQATAAMGQTILDELQKTNASVQSLGDGMMHITNLNYQGADATKVLEAAMNSAVSTGGDLGKTTNVLASIMREYNQSAGEAAVTMDLLHNASAQGNMVLSELVDGGRRAISTAANLGDSLADVSAAMSALTRHGFDAATAGTQVTGMLTHIVNPAQGARAELEALSKATGIDLVNDFSLAGLQAKGLYGIMDDVRQAIGSDTSEIFKLIPALRGGQGAIALANMGFADFGQILNSQHDIIAGKYTPSIDAMARTQATAGYQAGVLGNQIKAAAIALGSNFEPALAKVLKALGAVLDVVVKVGGAILTVLKPALEAIGIVLNMIGSAVNAVGTVVDSVLGGMPSKVQPASQAMSDLGESASGSSDRVQLALSDAGGAATDFGTTSTDAADTVDQAASRMAHGYVQMVDQVTAKMKDLPPAILVPIQSLNDAMAQTYSTVNSQADASATIQAAAAKKTADAAAAAEAQIAATREAHAQGGSEGLGIEQAQLDASRQAAQDHADAVALVEEAQHDLSIGTSEDVSKRLQEELDKRQIAYNSAVSSENTSLGDSKANWAAWAVEEARQISIAMAAIDMYNRKVASMATVGAKSLPAAQHFGSTQGDWEGATTNGAPGFDPTGPANQSGGFTGVDSPGEQGSQFPAGYDPATGLVNGATVGPDPAKKGRKGPKGPSAATLAKRADAASDSSRIADEYMADMRAKQAVTDAQKALNAVTEKYKDDLADLDRVMKGQATLQHKGDLDKLAAAIADTTALMDGEKRGIDNAKTALADYTAQSQEDLHTMDEEIRRDEMDLRKLEAASKVALAPLVAAAEEAKNKLAALRHEAEVGDQQFERSAHDLNNAYAALDDAETAAMKDRDANIASMSTALEAEKIAVAALAQSYEDKLVPLKHQLALLDAQQAAADNGKTLRSEEQAVQNLTAQLANARQGSAEWLAIQQQLGDAQGQLGRDNQRFTLDGRIKALEEEKNQKVGAAQADLRAHEQALKLAQDERKEAAKTYEDQKKATKEKLDDLNREKTEYDYQQKQKEIAAQEDQTRADAALKAMQDKRAAMEQTKKDEIQGLKDVRDAKAHDDGEEERRQGKLISDAEKTYNSLKTNLDNQTAAVQALIDKEKIQRDADVENATAVVKAWQDRANALREAFGVVEKLDTAHDKGAKLTADQAKALDDAHKAIDAIVPQLPRLHDGYTDVKNKMNDAGTAISTKVTDLWAEHKEGGIPYIYGTSQNKLDLMMTNKLKWTKDNVWGAAFDQLDTAITGKLAEIAKTQLTNAAGVGANIDAGIAQGITAHQGEMTDALNAALDKTLADGQAHIQAHSPSEVSAQRIGMPMGEGVVLGIDRLQAAAGAAMGRLAGAALAGGSAAVYSAERLYALPAGSGSGVVNHITLTPTVVLPHGGIISGQGDPRQPGFWRDMARAIGVDLQSYGISIGTVK